MVALAMPPEEVEKEAVWPVGAGGPQTGSAPKGSAGPAAKVGYSRAGEAARGCWWGWGWGCGRAMGSQPLVKEERTSGGRREWAWAGRSGREEGSERTPEGGGMEKKENSESSGQPAGVTAGVTVVEVT